MYQSGGESYCGPWAIRWNFPMEAFTRDGESSGFGRFVGLDGDIVEVQLWIIPDGLKVENAPGYAVQINTKEKVIVVLKKRRPGRVTEVFFHRQHQCTNELVRRCCR